MKNPPDNQAGVTTQTIHSQPSWVIQNKNLELAVTEVGAHMAPVTFCRNDKRPVQPYYMSPWQDEKMTGLVPVLEPLRGDFFCVPFGGNSEPWQGEKHPPHGETCGSRWTLEGSARTGDAITLRLKLRTKVRAGTVHREFTLIDGHNAVYCRTKVEGFTGRTPFAHHAILRMPRQEGALQVSTSKFTIGRTYPVILANPAAGEYQWLARDASFRSLDRVPSIFKEEGPGDCSRFPVRPGFCDLLQQFERAPKKPNRIPSWAAAVNNEENWLWFALKNPAIMPGRLFWIENKGRHHAPWSGRNSCLGIEDGCMYFDRGLAESIRPNPISKLGIPTSVQIRKNQSLDVRYIQGAIAVPPGFDRVADVSFTAQSAEFRSDSGQAVVIPVDTGFLFDK